MAYRSEFFDRQSNGRSVLEIALDIHCRVNGSAELGPKDDLQRDVLALTEVVEHWRPTVHETQREFDTCVLNLLLAAIAEAKPLLEKP